jgi:hypothetical protein
LQIPQNLNFYPDSLSAVAFDKGPVIPEFHIDSLSMFDIKDVHLAVILKRNQKNISDTGNIQERLYVQQDSKQQPEDTAADNEKRFSAKPVYVAVGNSYERPVVKSAIVQRTITEPIAVNTVAKKPDDETEQSPTYVLNTSINKTPLRGFFRKVSRVVDKVTGDDNGKGSIRIANLEIAVK